MPKLTPRERIEYRAARAISYLPPKWKIRLSGKPQVRLDGLELDPEIQLTLALLEKRGDPELETLPPVQGRAQTRRQAEVFAGIEIEVGSVRDITVPGPAGPLPARHYAPAEAAPGPHPLLVFLHGGGFVIGDLETHDVPCRLICKHAGVHVLAIDYRLAPEHPWPAAVEDSVAAVRWALEGGAQQLGADPARVAVGGDSAGGNLSTIAAQEVPGVFAQLLFYPTTDASHTGGSADLFADGFFLTREQMDWFAAQYLGTDFDPFDPRVSPQHGKLEGMPPAIVVTAGFDPLRDEGETYAHSLREAGVPVLLRRFPGLIHGFANMTGAAHVARDAVVETAGSFRAILATAQPARVPDALVEH